ncbi:MAG: exodeoxyribonuclease VII large subunit [Thiolinea sp.]
MFRNKALSLRIKPENGKKVLAHGRVGLYEPRGDYQFIIDQLEDAGEGELQRRFEALKRQLQEQGLFAVEHKQPLPALPQQIGVITSPTGAAIRDILHVLRRRCPQIPVLVYPVAVQGDSAGQEIVRALQQANRDAQCDVLILARGGGSLEDLWPFNEERVAQALHASRIPVVSGVGHEIDFTIADFVADLRAPTPSAAAELVGPDTAELQKQLLRLQTQLYRLWQQQLTMQQQHFLRLQQRLERQQPDRQLQQKAQRLDELELRLSRALQTHLNRQQQSMQQLQQRLSWQSPQEQLQKYTRELLQRSRYLHHLMALALEKKQDQLGLQAARLQAYSPLATLERGFALVLDENGQLIRESAQTQTGQKLRVRLADGELACRVEDRLRYHALSA